MHHFLEELSVLTMKMLIAKDQYNYLIHKLMLPMGTKQEVKTGNTNIMELSVMFSTYVTCLLCNHVNGVNVCLIIS